MATKIKPKIPIQLTQKMVKEIPVQFSVLTFYWQFDTFINVISNEATKEKYWGFGNGGADLNSGVRQGINPVIDGKRSSQRIYGVEAMAYVLSQLSCPCSVEQARKLVDECVAKNMSHANLCRKSDLIPVSPQDYDADFYGTNQWEIISRYPDKGEIAKRVSEALRLAGSPLRMKGTLRYVLKEGE